jgi:hypothetical protein
MTKNPQVRAWKFTISVFYFQPPFKAYQDIWGYFHKLMLTIYFCSRLCKRCPLTRKADERNLCQGHIYKSNNTVNSIPTGLPAEDDYMLIKDVTFLKDSPLFNIGGMEQKRVDLVLIKLIQPQCPKKIRPGFFFMDTGPKIFSMRRAKAGQLKEFFDRGVCGGKIILREMPFCKKNRSPAEEDFFFDNAVYGTVNNPRTQRPILNVQILLYPFQCSRPFVSTVSNVSGGYLIESIPTGAYRITASKPGYYTFRARFAIERNQQFNAINMQLFPKSIIDLEKEKPKQY